MAFTGHCLFLASFAQDVLGEDCTFLVTGSRSIVELGC